MAVLLLVGVLFAPSQSHADPKSGFVKGVALGLYFETATLRFERMVDEIADLGASHIGLVVQWVQHDVSATSIASDPAETISDKRLEAVIRHARGRGLEVFLLPIVHLRQRKQGEWRGTLKPTDWDDWWKAYEAFIVHYAKLAQRSGVSIFSVGSELVTTETMRARWLPLIGLIRKIFPGKLLYSANWDHVAPVTFWDVMDYVGLTGYFRLTDDPNASEATLRRSWMRIRDRLRRLGKDLGRPLLFTELGYPSQDGAAIHPWDYTTGKPIDLEEQRRCYGAFVDAWTAEASLGGVFFWNWFGHGGKRSAYYTPRLKPAEDVIRKFFSN